MVQSWNWPGVRSLLSLRARDMIPCARAKDMSHIDYKALRRRFEAVVFDKDNCLTRPYRKDLVFPEAVMDCIRSFGQSRVALISNCLGCEDLDSVPEWEARTGIRAILHPGAKKPACAGAVLEFFSPLAAGQIVVVGDRLLTDIAMANSAGMYSILVDPLTEEGDNPLAASVRRLERRWLGARSREAPAFIKT